MKRTAKIFVTMVLMGSFIAAGAFAADTSRVPGGKDSKDSRIERTDKKHRISEDEWLFASEKDEKYPAPSKPEREKREELNSRVAPKEAKGPAVKKPEPKTPPKPELKKDSDKKHPGPAKMDKSDSRKKEAGAYPAPSKPEKKDKKEWSCKSDNSKKNRPDRNHRHHRRGNRNHMKQHK